MKDLPYHHLPNGTFRNPEGSPQRDPSFNWSFKIFNKEKKKLDMNVPSEHVINKKKVLENLNNYKNNDYNKIASFFNPSNYYGEFRCDLHPRWNRDGNKICVDSPNTGTNRKMYIININN